MKKTFMLLAMAGACLMAQGQFTIVPTDTIVGRANHFYYLPYWYDDCHYYQEDTCAFRGTILFQRAGYPGLPFDDVVAEEHYAQQELAVRGLAAMVRATDDLGGTASRPPTNPWRNAETLILSPTLESSGLSALGHRSSQTDAPAGEHLRRPQRHNGVRRLLPLRGHVRRATESARHLLHRRHVPQQYL